MALTSALIGVAVGCATVGLVDFFVDGSSDSPSDRSTVAVTLPVEVGVMVAVIVTSIAIVASVTRDAGSGLLVVALSFVPNRRRLALARLVAVFFLGGLLASKVALIVGIVALVTAGASEEGALAVLFLLACAFAAGALTATLAAGLATVVRRPVAGVLAFIALVFALPLGIASLGPLVPVGAQPPLEFVLDALPLALLSRLLGVTTIGELGWQPIAIAGVGLAAWMAVFCFAAVLSIARRDP